MGSVSDGVQKDGEAPNDGDFANYFCTYAFLYHQKDMLEDQKRTGCYYDAVMKNQDIFKDSVVLDVGTGSGILALFAAKAGARKVYAVEATEMAQHARTLIKANHVDDRVVVLQGTMESVELPEKVDVIISEWMGYFLLRESMLDTVLVARDKYLKPGGSLFPSHANMFIAPIRSQGPHKRQQECQGAMSSWHGFVNEMQQFYGVDMNCLTRQYEREQREYYLRTAQWSEVHPTQLLAQPVCFRQYDLLSVTLEELKAPLEAEMEFNITRDGDIDALCGFFDVAFAGSPERPAKYPVRLSTAPDHGPCTHWGQLAFYLIPQMSCRQGHRLGMSFRMTRRTDNHRLMNVQVVFKQPQGEQRRYDFIIE